MVLNKLNVTMAVFVSITLLVLGSLAMVHGMAEAAQLSTRRQVTILPSAQRTSTITGSATVNTGENANVIGGYFSLNVTGVQTTPVITMQVQAMDHVSGEYYNLLTASQGVTTSGLYVYLIYPGMTASDGVNQATALPLPPTWRVLVLADDGDPITYSVGVALLN